MTKNMTQATPKYSIEHEINAPIDQCFKGMSSESAMMKWVPGIKSVVYDHSKATEPYGAGSERLVVVGPGISLVEIITESVPTRYLRYRIPSFGPIVNLFVKDYNGRMDFEAIGKNRTRLNWNGYFRSPRGLGWTTPLFSKLLGGYARSMASNAKQVFESEARLS